MPEKLSPFMHAMIRICCFSFFSIFISDVLGQLPSTRFDRLYPPSASRGAELEVKVAGADLEGLHWMKFSHGALKAEPKKDEDGEIVPNLFLLKVAGDAPLGIHKAWVGGGKFGASNYRSFVVGDLPEVEAGSGGTSMEKPFEMEIGQTALGKAPAGKYGWFKFAAQKGQRVLVEVSTKDIDSKLMPSIALYDASGLQLDNDSQGGLLDFTASADGEFFVRLNDFLYKGGDDYVYRLSVTTRARIDMVYPPLGKAGTNAKFTVYGRNLPGGQPSEWKTKKGKLLEKKEIHVQLPAGDSRAKLKLTDYLDPRRAALDHLEYRLKSPQGTSGAAFIGYGVDNPIFETDSNNDLPGKAQLVKVPCEFVGKFFPSADKDRIRFTAKKGDVYRIEVVSERLGRPSHAFLLLEQLTKKADGNETAREIGKSLETVSTLGGQFFDVSTRDPSLRFEASADGDYRILVYDLFNSSPDPLNVYRLSIRKEAPDFRLAAYGMLPPPASNNSSPVFVKSPTIRKGEAFPVKVLALRRDGFKDAIDLEVQGLPAFVSYSPKRIPEGADSVTVLFHATDKSTDWDGLFSIAGKSKVDGKEVRRDCRFADVCWSSYDTQAKIAVSHIQVVQKTPLAVVGREKTPVRVVFDDAKLAETAQKALESAEKASQEADKKAMDAQAKLKAPLDAERKAEQELAAKKKEQEDKKKARADLAENRIKTARGKLAQAQSTLKKADAENKTAIVAQKAITSEVAKAKASFDSAEKVAKASETLWSTVQKDADKPELEKQKAKQDADAKRKAAVVAKTAHEQLIHAKLNPANQKMLAAAKALTEAKANADAAGKDLARMEADLKKLDQEIAKLTAAFKMIEAKVNTAQIVANKVRVEFSLAKAAQEGRKAELERRRGEFAEVDKLKAAPSSEARVVETAVSGIVKIPVKLDSTDDFKAQTKVKVYGHSGFSKAKEINIDPKKKNEGVLELNLASAKLPAGEFPLFCSAQVKGKYKMVSENEAKKATEDAKKVDEQWKAAKAKAAEVKKLFDEAKKKLDQDKAARKSAESELAKAKSDSAKAKAAYDSAEALAKQTEEKAKGILADAAKPQPEKDAAQKDSAGKRKAANDLKLALGKLVAERLKPSEQKLADLMESIISSEKILAEAEIKQKDSASESAKLEAKKKKVDALAKTINDAFKKPKDLTVTLFTNPFTLKVRKAPVEVKPLGTQTVKAGDKLSLDVAITRLFGFADQVSFKVVPPKGAKGISAKAFNIVKDGYGSTMELSSTAATEAGEYECQLQGTLKFNNQNVTIKESFVLKVEALPENKEG